MVLFMISLIFILDYPPSVFMVLLYIKIISQDKKIRYREISIGKNNLYFFLIMAKFTHIFHVVYLISLFQI
ncbi:MAG: hypothetical protein BHW39_08735 [Firmicutes bacterium CAG:552_39_19]|nr:MAG: hypothetical protein BHW39_08735 [Firmicutes bacterium CAG:552_39_19]